jgi:hypothetical protein
VDQATGEIGGNCGLAWGLQCCACRRVAGSARGIAPVLYKWEHSRTRRIPCRGLVVLMECKMEQIMLDAEMRLDVSVGGKGGDKRTVIVRLGDFPPNAIERVLRYGFTRFFSDRVGGSDTTIEEKAKAIDEMVAAFKRGEVGRAVKTGVDPVQAEARKLIRLAMTPEQKKKLAANTKEEQLAKLDRLLTLPANAKFLKTAKTNVAERAKKEEIDVGDMDL